MKQEQITPKFKWKHKRCSIATTMLKMKNKIGRIMLPDIKPYYKAIVINALWY